MGFISKHLILLSLLFYLSSCVEGEQKVIVSTGEGVSTPLSITQAATNGSPPALPIPPNLAFTSTYCNAIYCPDNQFPFFRTTSAIVEVQISNPSNLPFTLEWSVNNGTPQIVDSPTQSSVLLDGNNTLLFPVLGFYTIQSTLKDSSGGFISNLVWSVELVGTNPTYGSFSPSPSPTPFVGSPFSASNNATQTISATISNPSVANYKNSWYLDGTLQSSSDQTGPLTVTFSFNPSQMTMGNHVVSAQLTDNPATSTVFNTATWSFEVTELPQFSSFTDPQLPSPAPFPDVEFGIGNPDILLDPNPLYNPSAATFTVYWELDGAIDASATFIGGPGNEDPPPYIINPNDATQFGVGRHSVVALLFDNSSSSPTLVDSASWNFAVVFPPPAVLTEVSPATTTQIFSVTTIPMDGVLPMGGFFQGPESASSRGAPMVVDLPVSSTDTFCLNVSDGRGIGFGYDPAGAGVLVQYYYSNFGQINLAQLQFEQSASPTLLCLDGSGAINPNDGVPNFSLSPLPPLPADTFITAVVTDKLSLQEIGRVQWNITVNPLNTQPTLLIAAPFSTTTVATVAQDATYTYSFTVLDQDCSPSLSNLNCYDSTFSLVSPMIPYPGIALNGTNTYYGVPTAAVTPNCVRDFSYGGIDKFSCLIMIPSTDGTGPMPTTGTYQVNAQVNNLSIWDDGSPLYVGPPNYYGPMVVSDMLTWNLTVTEINNGGPVLLNQRASGSATPTTDSYMYIPGNILAVAATATEGDSILFNLVVDDLEKDNYKIKFFHNTASEPATFTEYASPTYTYAISDNPVNGVNPASATLAPFALPFGLVTGAPSATITFRVQLTDVPDSASPITNSFDFYINVSNVNPPPVAVTGTELPPFSANGTVMQGFPYTMEVNITDGSVGEGNGLEWQWMVNQNSADCASQTAASWKSITGATEGGTPVPAPIPITASLTWSSPSLQISQIPSTTTYCFRNCIGDDDFPGLDIANCTPAMAGPWVGPIKGVTADTPSSPTAGYLQPNMGDTAVWSDPSFAGEIYGIHLRGNSIFLIKYDYQLDGTIIQTNGSFPTRQGQAATSTVNEGAYDVSMTGNNQFIFVSYVFNNPSFFPPFVSVPTNMVVKILKANFSTFYYFINDKVPADVGQVVANNSAFWVPFSNSSLSNTPFFFGGDGATPATTTVNGSFGLGFTVEDIQSREQGGTLYMALKLNDGTVNLYSYTIPALPATPTRLTTASDIFFSYYVPFTDMSLAVGPPSNPNVFVAGIDGTTKAIFYGVRDMGNLNSGGWAVEDLSIATPTYPATYDPQGLNAVASTNPGEVLLGFIRKETLFRAPFLDLYILKSDGTNLNLSKRINQNRLDVSTPKLFGSPDFALTNVSPAFTIGTAGAVLNENQKDTLWFRYWDFSSDRIVIINIENETFSGSTPTTGNAWSDPWFKQ
jgi:hypothetical protein